MSCCPTHDDIYTGRRKLADFANADCPTGSWAVLVAGDHRRSTLGSHVSVSWVGRAYSQLLCTFPPERIIVVAQIREVTNWLTKAAETGLPLFSPKFSIEKSKERWQMKLQEHERACRDITANGGADYDGCDVNAKTIVNVLRGEATVKQEWFEPVAWPPPQPTEEERLAKEARDREESRRRKQTVAMSAFESALRRERGDSDVALAAPASPFVEVAPEPYVPPPAPPAPADQSPAARQYGSGLPGRTLPKRFAAGSTILFAIYSHGDSHSSMADTAFARDTARQQKCEVCKEPHVPGKKYGHDHASLSTREWFAHLPYPCGDEGLYANVCYSQQQHFRYLLYWQTLFSAFHDILQQSPAANIVSLYQLCLSGGFKLVMDSAQYQRYFKVDRLPLYILTAAGPMQNSITGGLWKCWFTEFERLMKAARKGTHTPAQIAARPRTRSSASAASAAAASRDDSAMVDCATVSGPGAATLTTLYARVEATYFKEDLHLLLCSTSPESLCVACRSAFKQGPRAPRGSCEEMCAFCSEVYNTLPANEKPLLKTLQQQAQEELQILAANEKAIERLSEDISKGADVNEVLRRTPSTVTHGVIRETYGANSSIGSTSLVELFAPPRADDASNSAGSSPSSPSAASAGAGQPNSAGHAQPKQLETLFPAELAELKAMGFVNTSALTLMLDHYRGDVSRVVAQLLEPHTSTHSP